MTTTKLKDPFASTDQLSQETIRKIYEKYYNTFSEQSFELPAFDDSKLTKQKLEKIKVNEPDGSDEPVINKRKQFDFGSWTASGCSTIGRIKKPPEVKSKQDLQFPKVADLDYLEEELKQDEKKNPYQERYDDLRKKLEDLRVFILTSFPENENSTNALIAVDEIESNVLYSVIGNNDY